MTKSICLCVWQGDPVGEEKLLQPGERIWPTWYYDKSPSKWEYACNILECKIGASWPRMIPAAASTHLFHYLLEKMTVCPEANGSYTMNDFQAIRELDFKNAHSRCMQFLIEELSCGIIRSIFSEFFFLLFVHGIKTWPMNYWCSSVCSYNQLCWTLSSGKHDILLLPRNIKSNRWNWV